ncbi:class I SAM-dependent methyltransferase [Estrella lausannensis]|uniref:Methyltransferase n=1 Tax=Estrella lausannensis TaxID=483423 RepID=A0A0H5DSA2_9BACT|nr:methyltransferase domain-containing protein [Estrella lausannensis]CRX38619.1 Methyltransferase [Estrella lausannensis]
MAHWDNQARQWALIGEPLKPSQAELHTSYAWILEQAQLQREHLTVLVLGVTPEIIHLPWPAHTRLIAADCSEKMIESVLPKKTATLTPMGLLANWLQLPLSSSSIDVVIGDGCYSQLLWKDYRALTQEIRRVLKPDGLFVIRFFTKPENVDPVESIYHDLLSGKIASFHAFKLRLAISLQSQTAQGVCLKDVWNTWDLRFKQGVLQNMQKLKWNRETIDTIDTYHLSDTVYTFPTKSEIRSIFSGHFSEKSLHTPGYYLGRCCPTFRLSKI